LVAVSGLVDLAVAEGRDPVGVRRYGRIRAGQGGPARPGRGRDAEDDAGGADLVAAGVHRQYLRLGRERRSGARAPARLLAEAQGGRRPYRDVEGAAVRLQAGSRGPQLVAGPGLVDIAAAEAGRPGAAGRHGSADAAEGRSAAAGAGGDRQSDGE